MENPENFWERVKVLIKARKMTQESLAKSADVNFSNLKQQIFYNRLPVVDEAVRIARSLGTTVEYLMTGNGERDNSEVIQLLKEAIDRLS